MKKLFATIALLSLLVSCFGQGDQPDPGIAVEPQSQTAPAGSSLTLTVTASGTPPFNYQWWNSSGAIPDATNAIYTLNPAETNESDNYTVTITNALGSITSSVASVTIGLPPSISVQPMGQAVVAGSAFTLSVTASGTAPLNY
ncbi:MAG TPA: immunoglobulin domain-containing protein, partial [Candidatus Acidoferrum sp.]|nr:immunoglobulin domain-containing protein [Candidatus Acidoferrum sp.]